MTPAAARVLGWAAAVLSVAAVASLVVVSLVSTEHPERRDLEWLIIIPVALGAAALVVSVLALLVAAGGALWRWWRRFAFPPDVP